MSVTLVSVAAGPDPPQPQRHPSFSGRESYCLESVQNEKVLFFEISIWRPQFVVLLWFKTTLDSSQLICLDRVGGGFLMDTN